MISEQPRGDRYGEARYRQGTAGYHAQRSQRRRRPNLESHQFVDVTVLVLDVLFKLRHL